MSDPDSTVEKAKGTAKEVAGKVTGSDELAREGQAQQKKADKKEEAEKAEAEAYEAEKQEKRHQGT